jgi:uncharacterized protein (DUF362 family)
MWQANLTLSSNDRIAMDAVGVAALKMHGTTKVIGSKPIFEQDQIKRAVELGICVSSPEEIKPVPVDDDSTEVVDMLMEILSTA